MLVTSNFSFSHSVFKRLVSQGRQKVLLCGNGGNGLKKNKTYFTKVQIVFNLLMLIQTHIQKISVHNFYIEGRLKVAFLLMLSLQVHFKLLSINAFTVDMLVIVSKCSFYTQNFVV